MVPESTNESGGITAMEFMQGKPLGKKTCTNYAKGSSPTGSNSEKVD